MNYNISILKGFTISTVVINHYAGYFISDILYGYANGFIGLFFLCSGYLGYRSLFRNTDAGNSVFSYYFKRFLRIFPLYWLYLLFFTLHPGFFSIVQDNSMHVLAWAGLFGAPGHIWFIPALIHCYIAASVIFKILEKYSAINAAALLALFCFGATLMCHWLLPGELIYKGIPLGYLPLFVFGMFFSKHRSKIEQYIPDANLAIVSLYIASIYISKHYGFEYLDNHTEAFIGSIFLAYSCLFFCAVMKIELDSNKWRWLAPLGIYSYGIFLFHFGYFSTLRTFEIINADPFFSAFATLAFFPVFYLLSSRLEKHTNMGIHYLRHRTPSFAKWSSVRAAKSS